MRKQFFSGNSVEQAILRAASEFGIEPDRVAYTLRDKKHGFLKGRRRVVIEVDPASPELPPGAPAVAGGRESPSGSATNASPADTSPVSAPPVSAPPVSGPSAPRSPRAHVARAEPRPEQRMSLSDTASVQRAVKEILLFLRLEAEIAVERATDDSGVLEVEISRTDRDAILDREGRVLQAMEYLVPRLIRSWAGQGLPVKIDCEGFRAARELELRELAARTAEEVRREGLAQSLEPMHPADRRLVHLALAEAPGVATESDGEGYYKRVRIFATESEPEEPTTDGDVSRETWAAPFPR